MRTKIFLILFSSLISVLLTLVGQYYWQKYTNEVRYFEVLSSSQNFGEITDQDVKLSIDSVEVKNLQRVDIFIYNFNDRDVEDVEIFVDLYDEQGDPIKLISSKVWGHSGNREVISDLPKVQESSYKGGFKKGFMISNAKMGNAEYPCFQASFLIDSERTPFYAVSTNKLQYDVRNYDVDNYFKSAQYPRTFWDTWWAVPILLIIVLLPFILILRVVGYFAPDNAGDRRRKKLIPEFIKFLDEKDKPVKTKKAIEEFRKLENNYKWSSSSKFERFVFGYRRPTGE
ncbi:MAG: hypothetical protein HWE22_11300 [Flavobacteriales bacterium]|nr:hypothetical protein [Flavobacteriales bacterium]